MVGQSHLQLFPGSSLSCVGGLCSPLNALLLVPNPAWYFPSWVRSHSRPELCHFSGFRRRPLPGCVQDTQDPHLTFCNVIDSNEIPMDDQFLCSLHLSRSAEAGMIDQGICFFRKQFIECERRTRIVRRDKIADCPAVLACQSCPSQLQAWLPSIAPLISARHAIASASTSSAEI